MYTKSISHGYHGAGLIAIDTIRARKKNNIQTANDMEHTISLNVIIQLKSK